MEKASSAMKTDLRGIDRKFKALEAEANKHVKQIAESETLKKALQEKLDGNYTTTTTTTTTTTNTNTTTTTTNTTTTTTNTNANIKVTERLSKRGRRTSPSFGPISKSPRLKTMTLLPKN